MKPLPSLPSVSMKMKTICTAKPAFMPHGSSSVGVDVDVEVDLLAVGLDARAR